MRTKEIYQSDSGQRSFVIVLGTGDKVHGALGCHGSGGDTACLGCVRLTKVD